MKTLLSALFALLLFVSCNSEKTSPETSEVIRLNQLGYYPNSTKQFVLADVEGTSFTVVDSEGEVKFEGILIPNGVWEASGENVNLGDFSEFTEEGTYKIVVDDALESFEFEIKKDLYADALKASVKSFYFQRASMAIEESYGGQYARGAGHMDTELSMHPSSGKTQGTWNATGGWYDAGDYGKYVVNAALTVGQMLDFAENFDVLLEDGSLNIPESGNGVNDLLDEMKYELDWILRMQDKDGGVFFKLTAKNFGGFIMPEAYDMERFIIGKGTASTLNFAAVLAQASRVYAFDKEWSEKALSAAKRAYAWAEKNPNIAYINPEDVHTGEYGDDYFEDDFYWAATEMFLTTGDQKYMDYLNENPMPVEHKLHDSWKHFIKNNAFHSMLFNQDKIPAEFVTKLKVDQLALADSILEEISVSPYRVGLNNYVWGSNSDVFNQAFILCVAHHLTQDEKYLNGAIQITDYIFGKNATAYSFLTGFGDKLVVHPHHRPSEADQISGAIPGFVIGGPNIAKQDGSQVKYHSDYPAKSFEDVMESFASNEVCLNWNAPSVFVFGYLELHQQ